MKEAWRSGERRRDPTRQAVFIMAANGLIMTVGGFAAAVVSGLPFVRVLCGGALAYVTSQLAAAVRRA
jgi:hypothetical protein